MGRNLGPVLVVTGIVVVAFGLLAWSGALSSQRSPASSSGCSAA